MSYQVVGIAVLACIFFLYRLLNRTDTPKIKGLPEIPGLPLFGSLIELGEYHAVVAKKWAQKYGPVFQVRLGNKVCFVDILIGFLFTDALSLEDRLCQLI
jgi:phenylacetate 2-hydroxylase